MALPFFNWSKTAATNATADTTVNWAEGQSPSSVNDSARAMMASTAAWRDDTSGTITTGGTSTAYTVTSNQVFDTLAHMGNAKIAFVPHATNGATVTLNVDGLGAKPLRAVPGVELPAGALIAGTPYVVTYNNSDAAFYLHQGTAIAYSIPLGGLIPYLGSTAPHSNFALPFGQAISRTTYASLFALISTTFGTGDNSTTFNLPDLRNLTIFGLGNMGGSDRGLITNAVSGITGTTIGATGGAQSVTLARANLPNAQLTVTGTVTPKVAGLAMIGPNTGATTVNIHDGGGTGNLVYGAGQFAVVDIVNLDGGATASINGGVTQTVVNEMPPAMVLPYILRII
jgi:microcystin-dependent protein